MSIKTLIVLVCILSLAYAAETPKTKKAEIIDANHFYSE